MLRLYGPDVLAHGYESHAAQSDFAVKRVASSPVAGLRHLSRTLDQVRRAKVDHIDAMFRTLGGRLAAARHIERELDRALASRFNSLDYLRTNELGLSNIVADFLDPSAAHGQGALFLRSFLQKIGDQLPGGRVPPLNPATVATCCERSIGSYGRLDVSIEIGTSEQQPLCIAIENKPYAADGEGQVDAYLRFLRCRYPERFILIYLSPHGGLPSSDSLPPDACKHGLATLAYCPRIHSAADSHTDLQLPFALTDWLHECQLSCPVDRLRWFLQDTENYCHKTFGGVLTTDREHREVRDFILESENNLLATLAVLDAYPKTRNEVIAGFLECLNTRIGHDLEQENLESGHYFVDNLNQDGVWVHRSSWEGENATPYVWLGHDGRDASRWYLGVGFYPFGKSDRDSRIDSLRKPLAKSLGRPSENTSANWPWYRYLDQHRDWAPLLVRLHEEREHPGKLIEHFANEFVRVAKKAIKIVDGANTKR